VAALATDVGLVRIWGSTRPVGAGFVVDNRHVVTCAHVVNTSTERDNTSAELPRSVGRVEVRVGTRWVPIEVDLLADGWMPLTEDKRGDVAVLKIRGELPAGARAVPLRRPHRGGDRRFRTQGFPDGVLFGATGVIRSGLTIGSEWLQLEDDKQPGKRLSRGFSGAPIWDITFRAVVGMAVAEDAVDPAAKTAAMLPSDVVAEYWPPLAELLPSQLAADPKFDTYWDPRARGVASGHVPGWFFTGRRRALQDLVGWLATVPTPGNNVRVVTGGPGSGKTGLLARLVTISDVGYRRRLPKPLDEDDPLAALPDGAIDVAVYAKSLDADQVLAALATGVDSTAGDLEQLVDDVAASGRAVTAVVDGVDEAADPAGVASVLRRLAAAAGDVGLRLLVGTRPGPQQRLVQAIGSAAAETAINLDSPDYLERADLVEYVHQRLMHGSMPAVGGRSLSDSPYQGHDQLASQVAAAVADRAYPSFLIAGLTTVGLLYRARPVDPTIPGWDQFPATVADAMRDYLERFPLDDRIRIEDLLRPLAYTFGAGFPADSLWAELATAMAGPGRSYTDADVRWLIDTAADYLLEAAVGDTVSYRLYHQALVDHLRQRETPPPIPLVELVYQGLLRTVPITADGRKDWLRAHPYLLAYLADHAAETGHLAELLVDPLYLVAAYPNSLAANLRREPHYDVPTAVVYRLAAHILDDTVSTRLFQLYLHATRLGAGDVANQLATLPVKITPRLVWSQEQRRTPHDILSEGRSYRVGAVALAQLKDQSVVIGGGYADIIGIWNLETGAPIREPFTSERFVITVAVGRRNGRLVIVTGESGGDGGPVRIRDLETGAPIGEPLIGHSGPVYAVAIGQRNGRPVIISAGEGGWNEDAERHMGAILIWDLETGARVGQPLTGPPGPVDAVAIGQRNGRSVIVSGSHDGTILVWDLESETRVGEPLSGRSGPVNAVVIAERHGRQIIVSADSGDSGRHSSKGVGPIKLWDLETGAPVGESFIGHTGSVNALAAEQIHGRSILELAAGRITHPHARRWAAIFNHHYRMLLAWLQHALLTPNNAAASKGLSLRVFAEMLVLSDVGQLLATLPRTADGAGRAGAPFELPYSLAFPDLPVQRWDYQRDLVASARAQVEALEASAGATEDTVRQRVLRAIEAAERFLEAHSEPPPREVTA
jgi:Trypsin-like peptidase domain